MGSDEIIGGGGSDRLGEFYSGLDPDPANCPDHTCTRDTGGNLIDGEPGSDFIWAACASWMASPILPR